MKSKNQSAIEPLQDIATIAISGALVFYAAKLFLFSFILLPDTPTIEALREQKPIGQASIEHLIEDEGQALAILDLPSDWGTLGMAYALRAVGDDKAPDAEMMERARQALTASLGGAPANPYVWLRLAIVRQTQSAPAGEVLEYWRLSCLTGPTEIKLYPTRMMLGLALWAQMNGSDRQALFHDIRQDWPRHQNEIITLAGAPFSRAVIRSALLADLSKLKDFEQAFAERGPR